MATQEQPQDSPIYESEEEAESASSEATPAATCTHGGSTYEKGDTICVNKVELQCGNNGWFKNGNKC
jgi:hypothetical protein